MRRTAAIWVSALLGFTVAICEVEAAPPKPAHASGNTLPSLNLSEPFGAHPGWRFSASQGPDIADPLGDAADRVPGTIRLCVSPDGGRTCRPSLDGVLAGPTGSDMFSQPHFLDYARIVHPRSDFPLLLIAVASLHSGDGDQRVATVALGYDRAHDTFVPAYRNRTGRNRNEETRYVATGALRGAIIAVEPTPNAPFGFWVTVAKIGGGGGTATGKSCAIAARRSITTAIRSLLSIPKCRTSSSGLACGMRDRRFRCRPHHAPAHA